MSSDSRIPLARSTSTVNAGVSAMTPPTSPPQIGAPTSRTQPTAAPTRAMIRVRPRERAGEVPGREQGAGGEDRERQVPEAGEPPGDQRRVARQRVELQRRSEHHVQAEHDRDDRGDHRRRAERLATPAPGERQQGQRGRDGHDRDHVHQPGPGQPPPGQRVREEAGRQQRGQGDRRVLDHPARRQAERHRPRRRQRRQPPRAPADQQQDQAEEPEVEHDQRGQERLHQRPLGLRGPVGVDAAGPPPCRGSPGGRRRRASAGRRATATGTPAAPRRSSGSRR